MIRESGRLFAGREVLVVDQDGNKQEAPIPVAEALAQAKSVGLDLVVVAENSNPPVCRIMDYGKLQYEQKKRLREQRKSSHAHKLKEVKFKLRIEKHDYEYKIKHAIDFMQKGHKVKATLMFRGREMAHKDFGFELMTQVVEDLKEHGKPDAPPKIVGRNIMVAFAPLKKGKH